MPRKRRGGVHIDTPISRFSWYDGGDFSIGGRVMAERMVVGVDFSGAKADKKTWITKAELSVGEQGHSTLNIKDCDPIKRADLTDFLKDLPKGAVAALDFPFSVPIAFANYLGQPSAEMPQLWDCVANMDLDEFVGKRDAFVGNDKTKEYLRIGDLHFSGPFSCLHDTNPNMVPMTFYGMRMLHHLWVSNRFEVPPLEGAGYSSPVLLEVMPGAALTAYNLLPKFKGYKSVKYKAAAKERRTKIFQELPDVLESHFGIKVGYSSHTQEKCEANDDCLDSVVASTVAALWAIDQNVTNFHRPTDNIVTDLKRKNSEKQASPQVTQENLTELQSAKREGWIYGPLSLS